MINIIKKMPWIIPIIGSLTLGLAPFSPMPHLIEKIIMLSNGQLTKAVDIFDLLLHGLFPVLLIVKIVFSINKTKTGL